MSENSFKPIVKEDIAIYRSSLNSFDEDMVNYIKAYVNYSTSQSNLKKAQNKYKGKNLIMYLIIYSIASLFPLILLSLFTELSLWYGAPICAAAIIFILNHNYESTQLKAIQPNLQKILSECSDTFNNEKIKINNDLKILTVCEKDIFSEIDNEDFKNNILQNIYYLDYIFGFLSCNSEKNTINDIEIEIEKLNEEFKNTEDKPDSFIKNMEMIQKEYPKILFRQGFRKFIESQNVKE